VPFRTRSTSAAELFEALRAAVVDGPGSTDPAVRRAAFSAGEVPDAAVAYVDKVRHHAYKVTDSDVEALRSAGWSDDAIFEITVATALGAALSRRDRARQAMRG
jgi:alkylhydroperoxidase family enzyme